VASAIGRDVLAEGGNALDAAVATNLALGVVAPYLCGYGGDLFALIWDGRALHGYNGSGRAPAAATPDAVLAASGRTTMPAFGALAVTVPGAAEAWFTLLDRFGTRPFARLAQPALSLARTGVPIGRRAGAAIARARARIDPSSAWHAVYGRVEEGSVLEQPDLARTIETLAAHGSEAYYRGPIAASIAREVRARGGLMDAADLVGHSGEWVEPLSAPFAGAEVYELPPNTQGVTALQALCIAEAVLDRHPDVPRDHLLIESVKRALADRGVHVTDAVHMSIDPRALLVPDAIERHASAIDPARATSPARTAALGGGTASLCAADADGMLVSLIQSNYMGFGSGETVPGWGINLHNRGASFSLDPAQVNVIAPGKRPLHTLIPAMAFRDGRPWLAFGTMGGDGQAQTHLQFLASVAREGADIQDAIDAPRWVVSPADHSVVAERRFGPKWFRALRARGHTVTEIDDYDWATGHAHAIEVTPGGGVRGATDPRAAGAVLGP
jgi:gamma-glutamyltranspeptidase/glutathione hydrolase